MIVGRIAGKNALIPIILRGFGKQEVLLEAVIDTGFDDYLSLRFDVIQTLGLLQSGEADVTFADGSVVIEATYTVIVVWDGIEQFVRAIASDPDPLVGMALMDGYNLSVDVEEGGQVRLSRLGGELLVAPAGAKGKE